MYADDDALLLHDMLNNPSNLGNSDATLLSGDVTFDGDFAAAADWYTFDGGYGGGDMQDFDFTAINTTTTSIESTAFDLAASSSSLSSTTCSSITTSSSKNVVDDVCAQMHTMHVVAQQQQQQQQAEENNATLFSELCPNVLVGFLENVIGELQLADDISMVLYGFVHDMRECFSLAAQETFFSTQEAVQIQVFGSSKKQAADAVAAMAAETNPMLLAEHGQREAHALQQVSTAIHRRMYCNRASMLCSVRSQRLMDRCRVRHPTSVFSALLPSPSAFELLGGDLLQPVTTTAAHKTTTTTTTTTTQHAVYDVVVHSNIPGGNAYTERMYQDVHMTNELVNDQSTCRRASLYRPLLTYMSVLDVNVESACSSSSVNNNNRVVLYPAYSSMIAPLPQPLSRSNIPAHLMAFLRTPEYQQRMLMAVRDQHPLLFATSSSTTPSRSRTTTPSTPTRLFSTPKTRPSVIHQHVQRQQQQQQHVRGSIAHSAKSNTEYGRINTQPHVNDVLRTLPSVLYDALFTHHMTPVSEQLLRSMLQPALQMQIREQLGCFSMLQEARQSAMRQLLERQPHHSADTRRCIILLATRQRMPLVLQLICMAILPFVSASRTASNASTNNSKSEPRSPTYRARRTPLQIDVHELWTPAGATPTPRTPLGMQLDTPTCRVSGGGHATPSSPLATPTFGGSTPTPTGRRSTSSQSSTSSSSSSSRRHSALAIVMQKQQQQHQRRLFEEDDCKEEDKEETPRSPHTPPAQKRSRC